MEAKKQLGNNQCVTPKGRMAFCNLMKPRQKSDGKTRYEVTLLIPKATPIDMVKKAMTAALVEKFGPDSTKWPKNLKNPLKDGDDPKFADYTGYAGNWAISCSSNSQPGIVDRRNQKVIDENECYSGRWCIAHVSFGYYDRDGNRGVAAYINNVQLHENDEPFVGRTKAEDVFADAGPAVVADDADKWMQ